MCGDPKEASEEELGRLLFMRRRLFGLRSRKPVGPLLIQVPEFSNLKLAAAAEWFFCTSWNGRNLTLAFFFIFVLVEWQLNNGKWRKETGEERKEQLYYIFLEKAQCPARVDWQQFLTKPLVVPVTINIVGDCSGGFSDPQRIGAIRTNWLMGEM